jgi:hypothetical protein
MDVTAPRRTESHAGTPTAWPVAGPDGSPGRSRTGASPVSGAAAPDPPPLALAEAPWVPRSTLKSGLTAADVDVRFAIDQDGGITVIMCERASGEVLRRIPPDEVRGVIAALAGRGLIVDDAR